MIARHPPRRPVHEVLAGLRALSTAIDRLDQVAADRYGLNRTDLRGLDLIGQAGRLAPTELARRLGFTTGGVTGVIDRLERAGYVRRLPDPSDRRRLLLETTDATSARDAEAFGALLRSTQDALDAYSDQELAVIGRFLDQARRLTATHADTLANQAAEPAAELAPGDATPTALGTGGGDAS
jgi:DNA-binding MarR family transcriptional regulator